MNKSPIVFIGSTVVDILLQVSHLPKRCEDMNIDTQSLSLGGCAFNASWMSHLLDVKYLLFSPIGTGMYADYIQQQMKHLQLPPLFLKSEDENGCCYCLIEDSGERSFLSHHGTEYKFKKEWFSLLDNMDIACVYVCGLEIEEDSGLYIIEYLESHLEITLYFAPGPRLQHIDKDHMRRIFACHPVLHLNEEEALHYTKTTTLLNAVSALYKKTKTCVIVTLGNKGCCYYDGNTITYIKTSPVQQVDTTGAGDCHIGSLMAYRALGYPLEDALYLANQMAAINVTQHGALLSKENIQNK